MERTRLKHKDNGNVAVNSALLSRSLLAEKLGLSYSGDRNIYQALGYETELTYEKYVVQYERQDIAKAIIDRPVEMSWRGGFDLLESSDAEDTPLEKAWTEMHESLSLLSKFVRVDKLAGLGSYAVLLLGFDDTKKVEDFAKPVSPGKRKLLYTKPLGQGHAEIVNSEQNTSSKRFGLPTVYNITLQDDTTKSTSYLRVHHSRVIHIPSGGLLESEVEGTPRLQAVFNRLKDLEKLTGGSAEMFWRGARPGYQGKVDKDYQLTTTNRDDLQAQVDEFEHNLRRMMINEGVDITALQQQIADPVPHIDIQLQMISAETGIPKRILTGSELGELASSQDATNWLNILQSRRENYVEPSIIKPFVDRCIEYGVLPKPAEKYSIQWNPLYAASEKQSAEIGAIKAGALASYTASPFAQEVIPPEIFYKLFLGLKEEDIELIGELKEEAMLKEASEPEVPLQESLPTLPVVQGGGEDNGDMLKRMRKIRK